MLSNDVVCVVISDVFLCALTSLKAVAGSDPLPVSFRYKVGPVRSKSTHCYRPNPVTVPADGSNMAANMLGGVFMAKFNKIPSNKRAGVLWEARLVQSSAEKHIWLFDGLTYDG